MKQGDTFANRLSLLRHQKKLSGKELAEVLSDLSNRQKGYSYLSISGWESGDKYPPIPTLLLICDYFNVSADYLLGRSDDPGNDEIVAAALADKNEQKTPNYLVTFNDLKKFDGEPIYVVFNDKQAADRWGLMDAKQQRIVFKNTYLNLDRKTNCTYYTNVPDDERIPKYNLRKKLSMNQMLKSDRVWVEMISTDDTIKARYNGWFKHNENATNLINAIGLTLPYDGLSMSYNAYSAEF